MVLAPLSHVHSRSSERGFTIIEMFVVVAVVSVVAVIAMPSTTRTLSDLRLRSDARNIHNMVGLAKMRAGSRFTRERLYVDLTTESYFLQYWDKTAGDWVNEEGSSTLSSDVSFGYGDLATPPDSTQAAIGQAAACKNALAQTIAGTACVLFNSRGIPIDSTGAPTGNTAFYVTDNVTGVYGITVSATPLVRLWWSPLTVVSWVKK